MPIFAAVQERTERKEKMKEEYGTYGFDSAGMDDSPLYEEIYREKERRGNVRFFAWIFALLFAVFCLRFAFVSNFARIDVSGSSMYPTLKDRDILLMHYAGEAERGDVIIVDVRQYDFVGADRQPVSFLIKRLIGIEGDRIKEEEGKILISTAEEREKGNYAYEPLESQPEGISYELKGFEYEVGEGEIFFLGDNTRNSIDSRYKQGASHLDGLYKKTDIYGMVPQWSIDHRAFLEIWTKLFSSGGNGGT